MPFDGHSYLVSQGWSGSGTGLRQGAISKPLVVHQKKNLAGLGKDRDEDFPFWDHLFSTAAKSIKVNISSDNESSDDTERDGVHPPKRTTTGILSNRRPVTGTPVISGTTTPDSRSSSSRFSLLVTAKREAAKKGLYANFFRGPVLAPETAADEANENSSTSRSGGRKDQVPTDAVPTADTFTEREVTEAKKKKRKHKSKDSAKKRTKRTKAGDAYQSQLKDHEHSDSNSPVLPLEPCDRIEKQKRKKTRTRYPGEGVPPS